MVLPLFLLYIYKCNISTVGFIYIEDFDMTLFHFWLYTATVTYVAVCLPPTVYIKDVEQLFEVNDGGSLLLLVPIRLGGESLNPIYIPCVQVTALL